MGNRRGMYQRNLNYTFKSIQSAEGSYKNDTKRLFEALKNAVTRRTVDLIASSYSKVSLDTVAKICTLPKRMRKSYASQISDGQGIAVRE